MRLAVAEEEKEDVLAPRLGRALKFALFYLDGKEVRGPFYRVRHDDPGSVCDDHAELSALLHDCRVVIAGSVGPCMARRIRRSPPGNRAAAPKVQHDRHRHSQGRRGARGKTARGLPCRPSRTTRI